MGRDDGTETLARFAAYGADVASVRGHANRIRPVEHDCVGPLMDRDLGMALQAVGDELRAWSSLGAAPKLWWRDDDAYRDSAALQQLRRLLAAEPIMLAVVPGRLTQDLVRSLDGCPAIGVAQHGWKHLDHAAPGSLPSEYPAERARVEVIEELSAGQRILDAAFPARFHRVFVPPWHRCARWILQQAPDLGYDGVSTAAPPFPLLRRGYPGETHVEIDISDWSQDGQFIGADRFAAQLVKSLRLRRKWPALGFPIGILSHHDRMTRDDFACLADFIALLRDAGVQWPGLRALFPARRSMAKAPAG